MTILRPVVPDDSAEVARLLRENRDFMAPFEPLRDDKWQDHLLYQRTAD